MALSFFGIEMKADFSSSVAAVEFSKFADILNVALLTGSSSRILNIDMW